MSESGGGGSGSDKLLSILMPVYNERAFLERCMERVLAAPLPDGLRREIVAVDDCSTDGTGAILEQLAAAHPETIRAFRQERNQGKGAAIRRAIAEMKGEYAIVQDADLEYDPDEYGRVLRPLLEGKADVVYGSRFAASPMRRILNYHHALGNQFLTHLSNFFTGLNLTDMETCYKAFRADVLATIPLRSNRFGMEPEITAKVAKRNCIVYEVPISYYGRTYAEGKKIGWKDGVRAIYTVLKFWLLDDCYNERYGQRILNDLACAHRFHGWIADAIEPYLGDRILEVGSGIGNISRRLPQRRRLALSDMEDDYLHILHNAFDDNAIASVHRLDLTRDEDIDAFGETRFDSVVCLNVLEHIEDDVAALRRIRRLLEPGGRVVLQVPQFDSLYGEYDRHLDHFRRYTRDRVRERLEAAGFSFVACRDFNSFAVPGWWVNSCLLKRTGMGRWQLKIFDTLVPLLRLVERVLPLPGLSLIAVGEARG